MLNELLLALVGYPGPICQLDTRSNKIQLASDGNQFPFLHQSEKLQIDQICEIATLYYHLNRSLLQQDEDTNVCFDVKPWFYKNRIECLIVSLFCYVSIIIIDRERGLVMMFT